MVDQLDMSEVTAGGPPYHPRMMVKVDVLRFIANAVPRGQRRWRRTTSANISDFRKTDGVFVQVLALCPGLVKLGHVALDGTKVKANAKHKAMSYQRMQRSWRRR